MTLNAIDPRAAAVFREVTARLERGQYRLMTSAAHRQHLVA
jgi:hypothetical protein